MSIFNNPWLIGIGGGIISSGIVFIVTRYIFTRGENREYNQKVATANNEILYSIRPLIVERTTPTKEILDSILIATAKKYKVDRKDVYNEQTIANDLINEIMANAFLTAEIKVELCGLVNRIRASRDGDTEKVYKIYTRESKNLSARYLSTVIAIITGITTIIYFYLVEFVPRTVVSENMEIFKVIIIFVAIVVSIISVTLPYYTKRLKDKERDRKELADALEKVYGSKDKRD